MTGLTYNGEAIRHLAMPLGGIGTGQFSISGDGGLRQWQLLGKPNHAASLPDTLFAIRANRYRPPLDLIRILQSEEALSLLRGQTPLVNDDFVPEWQHDAVKRFGGVERTVARALYPKCEIDFLDAELPLSVSLTAWCPLTPLDEDESGLPVAIFDFALSNDGEGVVSGCIAGSLQNAVGWDGLTVIDGNRCPLYGNNANKLRVSRNLTAILMENPGLLEADATYGQMLIAAQGDLVVPFERFTTIDQLIGFLQGTGFSNEPRWRATTEYLDYRHQGPAPRVPRGPSPPGETWNGALAVPFHLQPGDRASVAFIIAWHFPNRILDFDQFGPIRHLGKSTFWLGNAYASRFRDAEAVLDHVVAERQALRSVTDAWLEVIESSTLPAVIAEAMAAQLATVRSPTCFRTADGRFFGFEGGLGASTTHWSGSSGGSCPLNANHVWNYEQAISRLFPRLERSMRDTEFEITQAPAGYTAHRVTLPVYLPQLLDVPSLGPVHPALDGMLGCPLKVYRELRQGASPAWALTVWPNVTRLMEYISARWDEDGDGVLRGEQPNTFDIAFRGPNTFIGTLWLAALLAVEQLAELAGDSAWARRARRLFDDGSAAYDALLWNGEYYEQESAGSDEHQYIRGCLTDQLLGQWWAHQLDLGYLFPRDNIRTALKSIFRFNFRASFEGFDNAYRRFADGQDAGLLVCSWPHGGRPSVPVEYCDETWTGAEYAWAALCLMEGLDDEGLEVLRALRARYDGTRRNPFNEIECGDHYVRSLAGWSVVEAFACWRFNALADEIQVELRARSGALRSPLVAGTGWGELSIAREGAGWIVALRCVWGQIKCRRLLLSGPAVVVRQATIDGDESVVLDARPQPDNRTLVEPAKAIDLRAGQTLEVRFAATATQRPHPVATHANDRQAF